MIRCECHCVCCDTQVFLLPGMTTEIALHCPGCGRPLLPVLLTPFDEQQWLTCVDPHVLLQYRSPRLTERKQRLFLCACCRLCWGELTDPSSRKAVEVAERFADGLASDAERSNAQIRASATAKRDERDTHRPLSRVAALAADDQPDPRKVYPGYRYHGLAPVQPDRAAVCAVYRDIMGNPFRRLPALTPLVLAWDDGIIVRLAQGIHAEGDYERLPILADALEEAGCTSEELLEHCRGEGPHVRGCWVVDLVMGKT